MDDLLDLDPVIPEPDFFDTPAENLPIPPSDAAQAQSLPPSTNLLDFMAQTELKYDDEMCEFDEFLVGLEPAKNNNVSVSEEDQNGETLPVGNEEEIQTEEKDEDEKSDVSMFSHHDDEKDEAKVDFNNEEKRNESRTEDESTISSSGPNTPESRAGSAVIRLPVPKISITIKSSSSKQTPVTRSSSPRRPLRGRLEPSNNSEQKRKRKLSEDEDFEPEASSGDEDYLSISDNTKSRSGRLRRKTPRYGRDDEDDDESHEPVRKRSLRGKNRNIEDSDTGGDSEVIFEGAKVVKKKTEPNYRTDVNGAVHYEKSDGSRIILDRAWVLVTPLSEDEILKLTGVQIEDDSDNPFVLEVCIDNYRSAEEAIKGGAKRIELCSALSEGGLTPTAGFLCQIKEKFPGTPVFVMIRPRGGDFVYSDEEIEIMGRDIQNYKQIGADGFVFGVLTKDCQIDVKNCQFLKNMAFPLECTFHRAFDKVFSPLNALEVIINLGFTRVLTSGQAATAQAGIPMIKRLVEAAGNRIGILPGAGVNQRNVADIVQRTGVTEVHGSASKSVPSFMCPPGPSKSNKRGGHKASNVKMGSTDDSIIKVTDSNIVAQIVRNGRKEVMKRT